MTTHQSSILGVGHYLPRQLVSNDELIKRYKIETTDQWIRERTGIAFRHFLDEGEGTASLAVNASRNALKSANLCGKDIDLVIMATTTPDHVFPATATRLAHELEVSSGAAAFDVQAACAGFIFALVMADNMLKLGQARCALIVGSDAYSRILDWEDRATCILFGDGAGAVVLKRNDENNESGIIDHRIHSDGMYYDDLLVEQKQKDCFRSDYVTMNGRKVFRHAVEKMSDVIEDLATAHNYSLDEIDLVIPHQANVRIIDAIADRLSIDSEHIVSTIEKHANISAASIPVALSLTLEKGLVKPGMLIAFSALGGGFSWGGSLLRWGMESDR